MDNYFSRLRDLAQEIDKGINELSETWKNPQIFTIAFKEDEKAAKNAVKVLENDALALQKEIRDFRNILEMDEENSQHFEESQYSFETLKDGIADMEQLFIENDYNPNGNYYMNGQSNPENSVINSNDKYSGMETISETILDKSSFGNSFNAANNSDKISMSTPLIRRESKYSGGEHGRIQKTITRTAR